MMGEIAKSSLRGKGRLGRLFRSQPRTRRIVFQTYTRALDRSGDSDGDTSRCEPKLIFSFTFLLSFATFTCFFFVRCLAQAAL